MMENFVERYPRSSDVGKQTREFVAAKLEGCPVRDDAVRAVGEIAADLLTLDFYLEYEARVSISEYEVYCCLTGVPRYDCFPPDLDTYTDDGYWPGTGPGRLMSIRANEVDDGAEIELAWKQQPAPA